MHWKNPERGQGSPGLKSAILFLVYHGGRLSENAMQLVSLSRVDEPGVLAAFRAVWKELALDEPEDRPAEDALAIAGLGDGIAWSEKGRFDDAHELVAVDKVVASDLE